MKLWKKSTAILTGAILLCGSNFIDAATVQKRIDSIYRVFIDGKKISDFDSNGNPNVIVHNGSTYISVENIGTENWNGNVVNIRTDSRNSHGSNSRQYQRTRKLGEIRLSTSKSYERLNDFQDVRNYPHEDAYKFDASLDSFAIYDLRGSFDKFEAKLVTGKDTGDGVKLNMEIYLDDRLAFQFYGIPKKSAPIPISLDLSGVRTMKIITSNSGSFSCGFCYLIDTRVS